MILTIGPSGAAGAHANFMRSDPAPNAHLATPPTRVLVGFTETVQVASSGLALLDRDGRELATQAQPTSDPTELVLPLPAISVGVYAVAWHTVSAEDGDAAKGYFAFEVGTAAAATAPPVTRTRTQADVTVSLAVSPGVAGQNEYSVTVRRGGSPLPNVSRVRLRITPLDRDIGQSENVLSGSGSTFIGSGLELPFAGRYRIQVQVRRSDTVDDLAFDLELPVSATASPSASSSPAPSTAPSPAPPIAPPGTSAPLLPLALVAAVALTVALGLLLTRRRR